MSAINKFLLKNGLRIRNNPCISPDFCLDWPSLAGQLREGRRIEAHEKSGFETREGTWALVENEEGDHAWRLYPRAGTSPETALEDGVRIGPDAFYFPATFSNLLRLKDAVLEFDPASTLFPGTAGSLASRTLGVGARFTTLHWPAVDWAMAALRIPMTANQNSIPRELVYNVDEMLAGRLDTVPFPFIGSSVPEGHQGQSVEGMSHGAVLAKLKSGFHRRRISWSFNADHQPIGGKFDAREERLVAGSILASYITFDLSPELAVTVVPEDRQARRSFIASAIPAGLIQKARHRFLECGLSWDEEESERLLCYVWPALQKMKRRDERYAAARERTFAAPAGRAYLRELSIDELPGVTAPETTAMMLALCERLGMPVNFIAPAFGFQKNTPFPDNGELRRRVQAQWDVCKRFGVSIGFHSGSGKSQANYRVLGEVTGQNLEIKTSGRYTYEMGVALFRSPDAADHALWTDWHRFTRDLAVSGAFSDDPVERAMARSFIEDALARAGRPSEVFSDRHGCSSAVAALPPSPDHMFWYEYNFLFVLAAGGRADKAALGDHSPAGYRQRSRFYSISDEGRFLYAKGVAGYIVFLAESSGLADPQTCGAARSRLSDYSGLAEMLDDIEPRIPSSVP